MNLIKDLFEGTNFEREVPAYIINIMAAMIIRGPLNRISPEAAIYALNKTYDLRNTTKPLIVFNQED